MIDFTAANSRDKPGQTLMKNLSATLLLLSCNNQAREGSPKRLCPRQAFFSWTNTQIGNVNIRLAGRNRENA